MKKKNFIIGVALAMFIFFNLSIVQNFASDNRFLSLSSIIQLAVAGGEDWYFCEPDEDHGYDADWYSCPPGSEFQFYYICVPVCYTSDCNTSGQAICD